LGWRETFYAQQSSEGGVKDELLKDNCRSYDCDEIQEMINEKRNEMIEEAGYVSVNYSEEISATTINNYTAALAMDNAVSLTQTSIRKTNNR
jgi:tRNA U54 and U55 pseudouridine synthase Pus10